MIGKEKKIETQNLGLMEDMEEMLWKNLKKPEKNGKYYRQIKEKMN